MPELAKKLQMKPNHELLLLNAPNDIAQALSEEGYTFTRVDEAPATGAYDAVQLFVQHKAELEKLSSQLTTLLKPDGMLWIAYPKISSGIKTD